MKTVTKIDKVQPLKTEKKILRVAAYCRVSTDSDAQLESLETQKKHYESFPEILQTVWKSSEHF